GPTEAAIDVTSWKCRLEEPGCVVPIGHPIANTRIYTMDPANQSVPVGVCGELFIAGVQLARGYFNSPSLTAERFIPDPFGEEGGRCYRTGDLGRFRADGSIEFLGRCDYQIKLRGFRIEPQEIEQVLKRQDGIQDAVVTSGATSTGETQLVAYITHQ